MGSSVVTALAFHRCGPGLILTRVICELSLFHVMFSLMPQGFFSGFSGFPPSAKIQHCEERCVINPSAPTVPETARKKQWCFTKSYLCETSS